MQLTRYKESERSIYNIKQETEDVLYSFIEEWKEENDKFLNKLSNKSNTDKQAKKSSVPQSTIQAKQPLTQSRFDFVEIEAGIDYKDLLLSENHQVENIVIQPVTTFTTKEIVKNNSDPQTSRSSHNCIK